MNQQTKTVLIVGAIALILIITPMTVSAAETLIKGFEGKYLTPYDDGTGKITVGYGSVYNYDQNRPVQKGDKITIDTANRWLTNEANSTLDSVKQVVKVPLNNNQFAALSSFVYNIGLGAFKNSTMLKLINNKTDKNIIANQFDKWVYVNGQISKGLKNRRDKEKKLFLS